MTEGDEVLKEQVVIELKDASTSTNTESKHPIKNSQSNSIRRHNSWEPMRKVGRLIEHVQVRIIRLFTGKFKNIFKNAFKIVLVLAFSVYLVFAARRSLEDATFVIVIGVILALYILKLLITYTCGYQIESYLIPKCHRFGRFRCWRIITRLFYVLFVTGLIGLVTWSTIQRTANIICGCGLFVFILITFLTSQHPSKVYWRPIIWGLVLQLVFAVLILRWSPGFKFFQFLGEQVKIFAAYTDEGSKFVFGDPEYKHHQVAFVILPVVIFFSAFTALLYYAGIMQWLVRQVAVIMQYTMGTTAVESLHAAASIFIGQIECCIMFRPFLSTLTESEMFAVMTCGFTTIAGTIIAAYIEFGAPAEHVLSAAIMSAPAAMALAKLQIPETKRSTNRKQKDIKFVKSDAHNVIEAACIGSIQALKLCGILIAVFVCFLPLLAFFNAILSYFGSRVGYPELSIDLILSYTFIPIAWMIGIEPADTYDVARLIGIKIFLQEFIAFAEMEKLLEAGAISERTRVITTYALAGFGSIPSIGIYMSSLIAMVPEKRGVWARLAVRAMLVSNVACMMTASIAGLLYTDSLSTSFLGSSSTTTANTNETMATPLTVI